MDRKNESEEHIKVLSVSPLFLGCSEATVHSAYMSCRIRRFLKGQPILSRGRKSDNIGFLLSGSAQVCKPVKGHRVILSTLNKGDMFGAAVLFSEDAFTNDIIAETFCHVLLLPRNAVQNLLTHEGSVAENYIRYLSGRICFLNSRIAGFTAGSADLRLAAYLSAHSDAEGRICLPYSMTELADVLSMGRASLYRAFERLKASGILEKNGNDLVIRKKEDL